MQFLELDTHRLHYRIDGPDDAPWLTFCNSLGTDLHMWDPQVAGLSKRFRILRYDRRGHGHSSAPPGLYGVADLGADVLALWDHLRVARSHFCGLSIGGLTGQWLGVHAGTRLHSLTVAATAAKIGTAESWDARIAQVRAHGLVPLREGTAERWFTPAFTAAEPARVEDILQRFVATTVAGYVAAATPWPPRTSVTRWRRSACRPWPSPATTTLSALPQTCRPSHAESPTATPSRCPAATSATSNRPTHSPPPSLPT